MMLESRVWLRLQNTKHLGQLCVMIERSVLISIHTCNIKTANKTVQENDVFLFME